VKVVFLLAGLISLALYIVALATLVVPAKDNVVHLTWGTDPNPARTAQTALFAKSYPGLQMSVDPQTGDSTKLIVRCVTHSGPDVIDLGPDSMHSLVDAGVLLDLTPYAKSMGFDPSRTYPAVKGSIEVNGKQYCFPCNVVANAVIYNKRIFDDHGVPYPKVGWTYDDFVRTARRIIETPSKSGEKHLAVANWSNSEFCEDLLIGHGGNLFSPDGLHCTLDSPEAVAALRQYYDLIYRDKVIPTPMDAASMSSQGGWGSGGLNWFSEGKAAMIFIGRWYIVQVPNFPNLTGSLGAVVVPRVGNRPSSSVASARAAGINAESPNREASLKFLQYLASPEYSRLIVEDGDSLPPNPAVAASGQALANTMVPDPAFHEPFLQAIDHARPLDFSPFIDAWMVSRWIQEYVDKTDNRILTPEEACRSLTAQIDKQIRINLERQPALQQLYRERTGKPYRPDWQ
jgi:multiple sugar transport system substrate-binding protein